MEFKDFLEMKKEMEHIDPKEFAIGLESEGEHDGEEGKDVDIIKNKEDLVKIVLAHLREDPKYYSKLKKVIK